MWPWLSANKKNYSIVPFCLLNIRNFKLFVLLLLIVKYILATTFTFTFFFTPVLLHFYLSHFLLMYLYFYSSMTILILFPPLLTSLRALCFLTKLVTISLITITVIQLREKTSCLAAFHIQNTIKKHICSGSVMKIAWEIIILTLIH